ncbi:hypothetical protein [Nitrosomonas sp. ANs5]|uniref:hypothetical protein n=1 Tax=Nitrosomonas sp. ANs5 TaxID=3423941 RepID=UPI003D336544
MIEKSNSTSLALATIAILGQPPSVMVNPARCKSSAAIAITIFYLIFNAKTLM